MDFSSEVWAELKFYVYRLIDPRNGQTFYVGKGKQNRVFAHAQDELKEPENNDSLKLTTIREIRGSNLEVQHIIHRHGMEEAVAEEVESALIDAYPGLTNKQGGKGAKKRGVMHADQLQLMYAAEDANFEENVLLVSINRTYTERGIYDAARAAWGVKPNKARRCKYVLAVINNIIREVYIPKTWVKATQDNFAFLDEDIDGRYGFIGEIAPGADRNKYINKRVPADCQVGALGFRYYWLNR